MGTFKTTELLNGNPSMISHISSVMAQEFKNEGYEVKVVNLPAGGKDISITKGGLFKAILGLKTALKITLEPWGDKIRFDTNVGLFGLQVIPAAIVFFVTWPVIITQVWGLIQQSKLDDKALDIAKREINNVSYTYSF